MKREIKDADIQKYFESLPSGFFHIWNFAASPRQNRNYWVNPIQNRDIVLTKTAEESNYALLAVLVNDQPAVSEKHLFRYQTAWNQCRWKPIVLFGTHPM